MAAARYGTQWQQVDGALFRSANGELHQCDEHCIRWVFRGDGLKVCAITGMCKNSAQTRSSHSSHSTKRRGRSEGGFAVAEDELLAVACAPEAAIAAAMAMKLTRSTKKRSFRSDAGATSDASEDMDYLGF